MITRRPKQGCEFCREPAAQQRAEFSLRGRVVLCWGEEVFSVAGKSVFVGKKSLLSFLRGRVVFCCGEKWFYVREKSLLSFLRRRAVFC